MNADDKRFSVDKKFYVLHDKVFMNKYLLNTHKFMWRTDSANSDANSVVLVSLLSTLDMFHTLFQHFYC